MTENLPMNLLMKFTKGTGTQKTLNSQGNPEKEKQLEESVSLTSDYTSRLQSSKQYGTGTETKIEHSGKGSKVQK